MTVKPRLPAILASDTRAPAASSNPLPARAPDFSIPRNADIPRRRVEACRHHRAAKLFDGEPAFSPDGVWIAFSSRRDGGQVGGGIWIVPASGGEARRLTNAPNNVGSFKWSRDGSHVAFTVTDPKSKDEIEDERRGRDWTVVDRNYKHTRLHAIDVASEESHVVTEADITVYDYDWSPDGRQLVVMAAPRKGFISSALTLWKFWPSRLIWP